MLSIEHRGFTIPGANSNTRVVSLQSKLHGVFRATGNKEHEPFGKQRKTVHYKIKEIIPRRIFRLIQSIDND